MGAEDQWRSFCLFLLIRFHRYDCALYDDWSHQSGRDFDGNLHGSSHSVQSLPYFLCVFGSFLRYQTTNIEREPYCILHDAFTTNHLQFNAEQKGIYLKMDSINFHHQHRMLILLHDLPEQHLSDGT